MDRSDFDKLLFRYASGEISPEEKRRVDAWLEVNKSKEVDLDKLSKEDEQRIFLKITQMIEEDVPLPTVKRKPPVLMTTWSLGIAATILMIISISIVVWNSSSRNEDVTKMILNDGTIVWLRGGSSLNYYESPSAHTRVAELMGEALFEVTKDSSRPFFINCGDILVKVLGTSFSIKTSGDSIELEVLTGLVNLSSKKDSIGMNVAPNRKVIYSTRSTGLEVVMTDEDVSKAIAETEYDMRFSNADLKSVFDKIEKKFDVSIDLENADIHSCQVSANFTDRSLESTLKMISEIHQLTYQIQGSKVFIKGTGCK